MQEYIKTDKPLVSILLAVYNPNEKWIIEQIVSLNEQTYENLNLYVYDDCPKYPLNEKILKKYVKNFDYKLIRGEQNKGSNKAFEELTRIADGEYFAYCDQDDIWEKNKISLLMECFKDNEVNLACCDLSIINENGEKIYNSIRDIRKRIVYRRGNNLVMKLLVTNFVTGCAMIVKKQIALKSIPFAKTMVHDNWIAVVAALNGKIDYVDKRLVRYRQHSNNQTGILKDVYDKKTYFDIKIIDMIERYKELEFKMLNNKEVMPYITYCLKSLDIRKQYFLKPSINGIINMLRYSMYYKMSILLELFIPIMPEFIFKFIIRLAKKGIL